MIRGQLGSPIYGLRIVEDITKRKRLEHELVSHATTARKLLAGLTPRETEVLELLASAVTASKIAELLSVSVRTVETHLANAYRKLGVRTKEDATTEFNRLTSAVAGIPEALEGLLPQPATETSRRYVRGQYTKYVEKISTVLTKVPYVLS